MQKKIGISKIVSIFFIIAVVFLVASLNVKAADTYQLNISKGTQNYQVNQYDDTTWKEYISTSTTPEDLFGGSADEIGAESKFTTTMWTDDSYTTFDLFNRLLLPSIDVLNRSLVDSLERSINDDYDEKYELWKISVSDWDFTTEDFESQANNRKVLLAFTDPEDFVTILSDYNDWVSEINGTIGSINISISTMSSDEFLYKILLNNEIIATTPIEDYLKNVVEELDCKNIEVDGTKLVFEKDGKKDYVVEITFSDRGMISSYTFKDDNDNTIYEITSSNSNDPIIIGVIIVFIVATGAYGIILIYKKLQSKEHDGQSNSIDQEGKMTSIEQDKYTKTKT